MCVARPTPSDGDAHVSSTFAAPHDGSRKNAVPQLAFRVKLEERRPGQLLFERATVGILFLFFVRPPVRTLTGATPLTSTGHLRAFLGDVPGRPRPDGFADKRELGTEFQFLRALWELDHALESASRRMKATFGVTGRERLFIRILGQRPGITPGEVAQVLHVHPSSVTALLKRLERRRLVVRRSAAADARSYRLELTRAGERINAMRAGTIEAGVREALASADPSYVVAAMEILGGVAHRLTHAATRGAKRRRLAGRRQRP